MVWLSVANDKFIAFIAAIFAIIFSSFYIVTFPPIDNLLPAIWLAAGSLISFGGFLIYDALKTRRQYPAGNNGIVISIGGFIALVGLGVLWFVYFVDWD